MKILILGSGSIGIYLGTMLHAKAHDVTLLGRNKLKQLHNTVLINDESYSVPKKVYRIPKNETYEIIFITSKLYDLKNNLLLIKKNAIKSKYVVVIQNGIVDKSAYQNLLADFKFTSISVYEGFRLVENQLISSPSSTGWKTDDSGTGKFISTLLIDANIKCSSEKNLESLKAEKTIMNCSINLLSAIEKKTFYELCKDKRTRIIIEKLFEESYDVLSKYIILRDKEELKRLFFDIVKPMRHYSSTYQDAIMNKKTEIDFLNGLIVKLGNKYHIPTPENHNIIQLFKKHFPKSI